MAGDCNGNNPSVTCPLVSLLISTHNRRETVTLCLKSLRGLAYPKEKLEIVLLDNGSTDGTWQAINEIFANYRSDGWFRLVLQKSAQNLGAFGGRAEALKFVHDHAEFVFSFDDDVEIAPDALTVLMKSMSSPRVGVAGAKILRHGSSDVVSAVGYFSPWMGLYRQKFPEERVECDFVSSCGCLIRSAALRDAGGFDLAYYTSHGDIDVCLKLKRLAYSVVYEPKAVIYHKIEKGGTRTPERLYYVYRNKFLLLIQNVPGWQLPISLAVNILVGFPKAIVESIWRHRGINREEMRSILWALQDAAYGRFGESRRFRPEQHER